MHVLGFFISFNGLPQELFETGIVRGRCKADGNAFSLLPLALSLPKSRQTIERNNHDSSSIPLPRLILLVILTAASTLSHLIEYNGNLVERIFSLFWLVFFRRSLTNDRLTLDLNYDSMMPLFLLFT